MLHALWAHGGMGHISFLFIVYSDPAGSFFFLLQEYFFSSFFSSAARKTPADIGKSPTGIWILQGLNSSFSPVKINVLALPRECPFPLFIPHQGAPTQIIKLLGKSLALGKMLKDVLKQQGNHAVIAKEAGEGCWHGLILLGVCGVGGGRHWKL